MANSGKPSLRIDWFDGSVIEDAKPSRSTTNFDEEEPSDNKAVHKTVQTEKKPIGFKRLQEISLMEPDKLALEVSYRPGFWNLFDESQLKPDIIVLVVKTLNSIFKTIRNNGNIKLTKQLETRFLQSNFLDKLIDYINTLPSVRIVDKRMNIQLWEDVEAFFFIVVSLSEGIVHFRENKSKEVLVKLDTLLKALRMSAIGVTQEHTEKISEDLFEKISKLETEIKIQLSQAGPSEEVQSTNVGLVKILSIFPTHVDIFPIEQSTTGDEKEIFKNLQITPSIVDGAYESVAHYLFIQFKLLREDYLGPLREGINKYIKNPFKTKHENIRVHPEVRILGTVVKNNKVGHLVDLACKERAENNKVTQKEYNKQLMFGSLLLFTNDNFHTILCATVLDSDMKMLKQGYVTVSFQNAFSKDFLYTTYLMVESEVFFEPYHQVLKVLQGSNLCHLPMEEYIVQVKPEIRPPAYLAPNTLYTVKEKDNEISFPVILPNIWPIKYFNLDNSQFEAYKFALTQEFAVIQGPPGTGKTYIGLKIASTLLQNLSLKDSPMLIICYTNDALDQFLKGILKVTDQVIRLGGQSKCPELEPYNINAVRAKMNCKHPGFYSLKKEIEIIYTLMTELQSEIEKCDSGIVCYINIKPYLKIDNKYSIEDRVSHWLFEHLDDYNEINSQKVEEDSWETLEELDLNDAKIGECFSVRMAIKQLENINNTIRQLSDLNVDGEKNPERIARFEKEAAKIRKRLNCFRSFLKFRINDKKEIKMENVKDVYSLSTQQRWQLYFNAADKLRDDLLSKMDGLLMKHRLVSQELEELSTQMDREVLRSARVVGATTAAAARRHALLKKLNSNIVIVEEAAEVLEAHIIASLTSSLQHLILIGDHKQLRPTAANYRLAKECNFEVSLFERMINNGIHARTLTIQRRMRPSFVELLVPEVYSHLDCHESVHKYKDVKGMTKNLFFLTHEQFEKSESDDSNSHENLFEAEWCVALARYLLTKGYTSEDVTVLATYNGQVSLIAKLIVNFETLKDVKITSVDNFQGEESRIVILSLVRSNKGGKIGFLSAQNRICVALSRAKEGFYIFGNMSILSKSCPLWMSINKKLVNQGAIGDTLCTDPPTNSAAELTDLISQQTSQAGMNLENLTNSGRILIPITILYFWGVASIMPVVILVIIWTIVFRR